ncbi:MAG: hypothetical protein KKB50_11145 [Planctomycetes bacterium]|nr:hypothetical protein [Planctomycetota bacterium]
MALRGKQSSRPQHMHRRWVSALAILLGLLLSVALGRLVTAAPAALRQIADLPATATTALRPPG